MCILCYTEVNYKKNIRKTQKKYVTIADKRLITIYLERISESYMNLFGLEPSLVITTKPCSPTIASICKEKLQKYF